MCLIDLKLSRLKILFPDINKYAEAYETEIKKLIENMNMDIKTVLVEYRDI